MFSASTLYVRNAELSARSSELHESAHPPPPQTMMVLIPRRGFASSVSAEVPSLASFQLRPLLLLPWCLFASVSHISFRFLVSCA